MFGPETGFPARRDLRTRRRDRVTGVLAGLGGLASLGLTAVMITALPAEIPNVPDERTYAATLPTGDESGAPAAHGDIAGIGSSDMAQAAVPLTSDGPLHSLALTIVTLVIGALGFFVGWYLLRRPGRGPHGRSRSLAIAGWAALGMIADSFLILWLLVWLGGPYWLHPLLWLLTVVPVAIVCAAAARKEGACT